MANRAMTSPQWFRKARTVSRLTPRTVLPRETPAARNSCAESARPSYGAGRKAKNDAAVGSNVGRNPGD